jgi:hypothetical protein
MIDFFAIGLTHALILLAALRLLSRADLDRDPAPGEAVTPAAEAPKTPEARKTNAAKRREMRRA